MAVAWFIVTPLESNSKVQTLITAGLIHMAEGCHRLLMSAYKDQYETASRGDVIIKVSLSFFSGSFVFSLKKIKMLSEQNAWRMEILSLVFARNTAFSIDLMNLFLFLQSC